MTIDKTSDLFTFSWGNRDNKVYMYVAGRECRWYQLPGWQCDWGNSNVSEDCSKPDNCYICGVKNSD